MSTTIEMESSDHFVPGGFSRRIAERFGFRPHGSHWRITKVSLLIVVTWVPLLILSLLANHFWGHKVKVSFLRDIDTHGRFLFVLPLLEIGSVVAAAALGSQMRHFRELKIIAERDWERFRRLQVQLVQAIDSSLAEGMILFVSYVAVAVSHLCLGFTAGDSSWERTDAATTTAGWWLILVSLPVLNSFLMRRLWVFLLWAWFLFRVSRLDLQLSATHPDHAGGLSFISRGLGGFSIILMACAALAAAIFCDVIVNRGKSLADLKYHVAVFEVVALLIVHLPLLPFCTRMILCRHYGLLEISGLILRYERAFEVKWLGKPADAYGEELLANPDFQTFASVGVSYDHANQMRPIPTDNWAFCLLVAAALIPMIALIGTKIPMEQTLIELSELLG